MLLRIVAGAVVLVGCTSTYHPEYHPVTVTTVQQTSNAPNASPPQLVVPQPALADPDVVFK